VNDFGSYQPGRSIHGVDSVVLKQILSTVRSASLYRAAAPRLHLSHNRPHCDTPQTGPHDGSRLAKSTSAGIGIAMVAIDPRPVFQTVSKTANTFEWPVKGLASTAPSRAQSRQRQCVRAILSGIGNSSGKHKRSTTSSVCREQWSIRCESEISRCRIMKDSLAHRKWITFDSSETNHFKQTRSHPKATLVGKCSLSGNR